MMSVQHVPHIQAVKNDAITHWMPLPEAPQEVLEEYAFPDSPRQMAMKQPLNENGGT